MKLKRIISALVVFALVMASAVCSVSADATYSAYTTYTITENGVSDVTINASITGATEGDMVSYILHEGTEVTEDSIVHIDQGTAGADGSITFVAASYPKADVLGTTFKFTSSAGTDVARYTNGATDFTKEVHAIDTIDEYALGINFISSGISNSNTAYVLGIKEVVGEDGTVNYDVSRDKIPGNYGSGNTGFNGSEESQRVVNVPLDVDTIAFQFNKANNRTATQTISFKKVAGSYNGVAHTVVSSQTVFSDVAEEEVNKLVGNVYKESITDGTFAGIPLEGGCVISIDDGSCGKDETTGSKIYMIVDRLPIMTKVTNANGVECDSVTFLVSYTTAAAGYTGGGVDVYRYSAEAGNSRLPGNSEGAVGEYVGTFDDLVEDGTGRFAIQLVDEMGTNELDPAEYYFVAIPYYYDADGVKVELNAVSGTSLYTQAGNVATSDSAGFNAEIVEE